MHRYLLPVAAALMVMGAAAPAWAASPLVGRFEAEQTATYNSNLTLAPDGPGDLILRTKVGGTLRYALPTRTLLMGQANANWINFAQNGTFNTAMGIVNGMVMQPIFDFATVYGGGMLIVSQGLAQNGVLRFDKDAMLGGLLQTPVSKAGAIFGGYHLDTMMTEVAQSAYFGHTFQVGYRHVINEAFNLTGGYRFMLKDSGSMAGMLGVATPFPNQGRHTVGVTGRYALLQNVLNLQGRTEYTFVTSDTPTLNTGMLDLSLLLNGGF